MKTKSGTLSLTIEFENGTKPTSSNELQAAIGRAVSEIVGSPNVQIRNVGCVLVQDRRDAITNDATTYSFPARTLYF